MKSRSFILAAAVIGMCAFAGAQVVTVSSDIAVSTTWTNVNTYKLGGQVYVLPGATLTIQAGTVIASDPLAQGSLAVCRGAQIHVQGTAANPVIFTSTADVATWAPDASHPTGKNPRTGSWRAAMNEWGNLTIMGSAFISENAVGANSATPNAANYADMEGLTAPPPLARYGGGDDYDNSGSVAYLSIRYGGKVIGLANELNGLSLGGIGRGTTIHHVEIMNNVDDGIEIWGGTVNLKHVSIWNVGDDSLDVDQGWRGKAQFLLIVQGYSQLGVSQGSGVGDNAFELDGAEQADYQPVTTGVIYNATVIGNPGNGLPGSDPAGSDHMTAWRDNCRMQFRNCIFMNAGERLVAFDNVDGDGGAGYGAGGTLSWANTWTTPYSTYSAVNAPTNPAAYYQAQTSGNLIEIKDSVFYNNVNGAAYTESNNRGVNNPANNNVQAPATSPIVSVSYGPSTVYTGSNTIRQVLFVNPIPQNDALTSVAAAPNDGFFTPASYRGAFAPGVTGVNWLCGWTASTAFGLSPAGSPGPGQPGVAGAALLDVNDAVNFNGCGVGNAGDPNGPFYTTIASGQTMTITINGQPNQSIIFMSGPTLNPSNFDLLLYGLPGAGFIDIGSVTPTLTIEFLADGSQPGFFNQLFKTGATGTMTLDVPASFTPGTVFNFQAVVFNTTTFLRASNSVQVTIN